MNFSLKLNAEDHKKFIRQVAEEVVRIQDERKASEPLNLNTYIQTYSVKEVADIANLSEATIYKHIKMDPPLLHAKRFGKKYIIPQESLDQYIGRNAILT